MRDPHSFAFRFAQRDLERFRDQLTLPAGAIDNRMDGLLLRTRRAAGDA